MLRGAKLRRVVLKPAEIRDGDGRRTGRRVPASLVDCDLRAADFADSDLRAAVLTRAQLRGARFTRARLDGAQIPARVTA